MSRSKRLLSAALGLVLLAAGIVIAMLIRREAGRDAHARDIAPSDPRPQAEVQSAPAVTVGTIPTQTFREPAATPSVPALRIRIVHSSDEPVAGARAFHIAEGRVIARVRTDAAGAAGFERCSSVSEVLVVPQSRPPWSWSLPADATGEHRLALPRGSSVAGLVDLDGRTPPTPLALRLHCDPLNGAFARLAALVTRELEEEGIGIDILSTTTDAAGHFAFPGLHEAWAGEIEGPFGTMLADHVPDQRLWLPRPRDDVRLRLVSAIAFSGRVVGPGSPEPSGWARVGLQLRTKDESGFGTSGFTDLDGRFRIEAPPGDWVHAELRIATMQGWSANDVVREGDFHDGAELGELELAESRVARFRTVDPAGVPLAGMMAIGGTPFAWVASEATKDDGRGRIWLPVSDTVIWVGGLGREVVRAELVPGDDEMVIALRARPVLELKLESEVPPCTPSVRLDEYRIVVRAAAPSMGEDWRAIGEVLRCTGADPGSPSCNERGVAVAIYLVDCGKQAILADLPAGVPLQLQVCDLLRDLGDPIALVLQPEERRELVIRLPPQGASCSGCVRTSAGEALEYAVVRLENAGSPGTAVATNRDGTFSFGRLHRGRADLIITAEGFAAVTIPDVELRPDAAPITVTLAPSISIR